MNIKEKYKSFETVVLRTPTFPLMRYIDIPDCNTKLENFINSLYYNSLFKEAIFLASPELYTEWEKSMNIPELLSHKKKHLYKSILKYYIRSITNCVPFGLFASYSLLDRFNTHTCPNCNCEIMYADVKVTFIMHLIDLLNHSDIVKDKLMYHANDTIHIAGANCRYIESSKNESEDRKFVLTELDFDPVVKLIISSCKTEPKSKIQLMQLLLNHVENVTEEEVKSYIEELINSKVLQSSLDLCVNGFSPLLQLNLFIKENLNNSWTKDNYLYPIISSIIELGSQVEQLAVSTVQDRILKYNSILNIANHLWFNKKKEQNIIDIDLKKTKIPESLSRNLSEDNAIIHQAIKLMSILVTQEPHKEYKSLKNLHAFKKAFLERYENREVSLLQALDKELGIGYTQSPYDSSSSDFIDDLQFPDENSNFVEITTDTIADKFWYTSIVRAIKEMRTVIDLKEEDLSVFENRKNSLIGTFPVVYTYSNNKIYITSAGGTSALLYLGRFMSNDMELAELGREIIQEEENSFPEKILAEIIHLPTYKGGKIAIRNVQRKYEIPIMDRTSQDATRLELDDFTISINENNIILRSRKYNKEVIPFLSCAQNFNYGTIPIYHFLCDLQFQYRANLLSLDLSPNIKRYFNYIPRIEYDKKLVLSLARWQFTISECGEFLDHNSKLLFKEFQNFKLRYNIPRYINLLEEGNEPLTLDTDNKLLTEIIVEQLKKRSVIRFVESIYDFTEKHYDIYANEYIVSFKGDTLNPTKNLKNKNTSVVKRSFIPGDEWLYFKIYTGANMADKILATAIKDVVNILTIRGLIDKWFFIRYNDPKFHIRIRFHFENSKDKNEIINIFNNNLQCFKENDSIWKMELSTYERELERYFHKYIIESESIFYYDSQLILDLLVSIRESNDEGIRWLYAIQNIHEFLEAFEIPIQLRENLLSEIYKDFSSEFNVDKKVRKQIDLKFRENLSRIENILSNKEDGRNYLFEKRKSEIKPIIKILKSNLPESDIYKLLVSHIHMSINKLIRINPRIHELVCYGILSKYYKKHQGTLKHKISK